MDKFPARASAREVRAGFISRLSGLLVGLVLSASVSSGQDSEDKPLLLQGMTPSGGRASVTESWGTLQFTVTNPNATGRDARVAAFYPERPGVQYARDVWVPGRSSLTTWLTIGPAISQKSDLGREIQMTLYDRTGGANRLVLPPGDERIRSRRVLYRRREQTTALMADFAQAEPGAASSGLPPELLTFARLPRLGALSEHIAVVQEDPLPLAAEALDGVDVFILAGNRLATDPSGRAALRRWVQQGGRLWVMLDRVDLDVVAPILGDDFEIGLVDRVGLTTVRLRSQNDSVPKDPAQDIEEPVPFVRVVPSEADHVFASVDGWPAAFSRRLGRGRVLFTTLGSRGWSRPRVARDGKPPFANLPDFPTPLGPVTFLSSELHQLVEKDPLPPEVFQPMLAEEIGYSIIGRGTVALILGGFVLTLAGLRIGLRRHRRPELVVGLTPLVAGAAVLVFVALAEQSRQAVPPTVAVAAIVDPVPGSDEAALTGMYALHHPSPGPAMVGTGQGAALSLNAEGLDGQTRVRAETDTDVWRWDGLAFPAGTRTGTIRTSLKTGPITALGRFGPNGLEGTLRTGTFTGLTDAMIFPRTRDPLTVRLGAEGAFTSGAEDVLPSGQYLADSVLTDRQQRRQAVYRQLHEGPPLRHLEGRDVLWVWADAPDVPMLREEGAKVLGNMLLAVPLEFERTPVNTQVLVPRGLVPVRRVLEDGQQLSVSWIAQYPADMRLRFQIPPSVLPFQVERATLFIHPRLPSRRLSVSAEKDGKLVSLREADAPNEMLRIDIADPSLLQLDKDGGLFLRVAIGKTVPGVEENTAWKIESLSLEVAGRTGPKP